MSCRNFFLSLVFNIRHQVEVIIFYKADTRQFLIQLRNTGNISAEVLRRMEYELDLEETRLILEKGQI